MGLEPERLVGHQRVGRGVGLVETVTGELLHQVEDVLGQVPVNAIVLAAIEEYRLLLGHFLGFFLAHGTPQHVGAAERIAGHHLGNLHDLLLVQNDPVGGLQDRLQPFVLVIRVWIRQGLATMFPVNEVVHHPRLQRPRAEQGHQGDHVFQGIRLQAADQVLHTSGFQLEHRRGLGALEHVERGFVVQWDGTDIQRRFAPFFTAWVDHVQSPLDDGQRAQPQKVELDQPRLFHIALVELGDQAAPLVVTVQRREVGNLGRGDDHATGVLAGVPAHPFQFQGHFPDFLGLFVLLQEFLKLGLLLQGLVQGHAHFERNQLGQLVRQTVGLALHPRHVAHHRLGGHGTEGDDLGHRLATVLAGGVLDDPVPPLHAEVHVEVGHGHPLRVQEALEQQVVLQRVQIGDQQRVGHQRAGPGTPARPHRNAVVLGPLDKVHHDQEVARKAHLGDDVQLKVQAIVIHRPFRLVLRVVLAENGCQTLLQPLLGDLTKIFVHGHALGDRVIGQEVLPHPDLHRTTPGDLQGVLDGLGNVREQFDHFLGGAQVLLIAEAPLTTGIVQRPPLADADPGLVGLEVLRLQKVHVVGGHHRQPHVRRQRHTQVQAILVARAAGALQFQVVAVRVEIAPVGGTLPGQFLLARQ